MSRAVRRDPDGHVARVQAAALVDAWLEGSRHYWLRRAAQLETARPRRDDFTGRATLTDIVDRHRRLTEAAEACRARATGLDGVALVDLADALSDVTTGAAA